MAGDSKKVQPIIIKRIKKGASETAEIKARKKAIKAEQAIAERSQLAALKNKMEEVIANDSRLAQYKSQIRLDLTAEGLRIQIVDDQSRPMFDSGKAEVKGYMRDILQSIGAVLSVVPNRLTIEGHTDAKPFSSGERGYSNWELSADRANASRRELIAGGLAGEKVLRMQGLAASLLYEKDDPESPLNRRISIVVMNREAEDRFFQAAKVESSQADEETTDSEIPAALANPIKASSLPTERR